MQTNFEVENNYSLISGIDGFCTLYYRGDEIATIHSDRIDKEQASDGWEYESNSEEYTHRLFIAVGIYESSLDY